MFFYFSWAFQQWYVQLFRRGASYMNNKEAKTEDQNLAEHKCSEVEAKQESWKISLVMQFFVVLFFMLKTAMNMNEIYSEKEDVVPTLFTTFINLCSIFTHSTSSLVVLEIFFIQLFLNWTACSPIMYTNLHEWVQAPMCECLEDPGVFSPWKFWKVIKVDFTHILESF